MQIKRGEIMKKILLSALILFSTASCAQNMPVLFEDPLDGEIVEHIWGQISTLENLTKVSFK
jgi:hypothetical protein